MKVTVSAVLLCSLLLSCQAAPAPLIDPISSSFALGGLTGSFALAEGLTLGLAASSTTIPTWLLALKAGLLGKSLLLSAGTAGAGVGAAATRAAITRENNLRRYNSPYNNY